METSLVYFRLLKEGMLKKKEEEVSKAGYGIK